MGSQTDRITWTKDGVPVSSRFDDPFFSLEDGVAETRHVFLAGNDLPARYRAGFHIAELGFGTGLNALVAWDAWIASGQQGVLRFTSFEAYPMSRADMAEAHKALPAFDGRRDLLLEAWQPYGSVYNFPQIEIQVIQGDARETLPVWTGKADAWFLDGFSPAKNPELWGETLLEGVAKHTHPYGTCATYTAAGFVRRGLEAAGFAVNRTPGFGRKRHMTRGVLR